MTSLVLYRPVKIGGNTACALCSACSLVCSMSCVSCLVCQCALAGEIILAVRICPALWVGCGRWGAPPKSPSNRARGGVQPGRMKGSVSWYWLQLTVCQKGQLTRNSAGCSSVVRQSFTDTPLLAGLGCGLKRPSLACYQSTLFRHFPSPIDGPLIFLCSQNFHQ